MYYGSILHIAFKQIVRNKALEVVGTFDAERVKRNSGYISYRYAVLTLHFALYNVFACNAYENMHFRIGSTAVNSAGCAAVIGGNYYERVIKHIPFVKRVIYFPHVSVDKRNLFKMLLRTVTVFVPCAVCAVKLYEQKIKIVLVNVCGGTIGNKSVIARYFFDIKTVFNDSEIYGIPTAERCKHRIGIILTYDSEYGRIFRIGIILFCAYDGVCEVVVFGHYSVKHRTPALGAYTRERGNSVIRNRTVCKYFI